MNGLDSQSENLVAVGTQTGELAVAEASLSDELWLAMAGEVREGEKRSEKERLLEWTGIADALVIRKEIAATGTIPTKENRLVQIRNEIVNNEANLLTTEDLAQIETLNKYLREEPELTNRLIESLIGVQEKMLDTLGVGVRSSAIDHVREVVALVKKSSPEMPLAALMAAVHDMVKLTAVEDEKGDKTDLILTAEHEVLSAAAAGKMGDILATHLAKAKGWEGITYFDGRRGGVAKLFSYILTHGEGEYPEGQAKNSDVIEIDGVRVGTMGGGEYVFNPGSTEVNLTVEGVEAVPARSMLEAVSAADKLVGMSPDSLVKYLTFTPEKDIFGCEDTDDLLFNQVFASFVDNYSNSPESQLKSDFLHSDEVHQSVLVLLALRENDQGKDGGSVIPGAVAAEAQKFKGFFEEVKNGKTVVDNPKSMLVTYFRELVKEIKKVDLAALPELEKMVREETERILVKKL